MFLSILTFHFGVTFDFFGGLMSSFLGFGSGSTPFLGSTHVVEQLSFSLFLSILTFDFDLILGSFLPFWALMGYFCVGLGFKNCFAVSSYRHCKPGD